MNNLNSELNRKINKLKQPIGSLPSKARPNDPYSFKVFMALHSWLTFWPVILTLGFAFIVLFVSIGTISWRLMPIVQLFLLVLFADLFYIYLKFISFKHWEDKLNFKVIGWKELIEMHSITDSEMYRELTLSIQLKENQIPGELVKKSLQYLVMSINQYKEESRLDEKKYIWSLNNLQASGIANTALFEKLRRWLIDTLNDVSIQEAGIDAVTIKFSMEEFRYSEPSDTMS